MMTMMASLVEWRSNSSPFFPSSLLFCISWFLLLISPSPSLFYPPLTFFFLLFSNPHIPHTAATQSAGTGNSFLHDDVRTSAISCFLLLNGYVFGTLHHITSPFGFLFTWTLGFTWEVHISYTIYPYGHEVELDWNWYSDSLLRYIISRYTISYCVFPFFPFFPCVFCHFVCCVEMRRGCFNLGLYHYLCIICYYFSFCLFS